MPHDAHDWLLTMCQRPDWPGAQRIDDAGINAAWDWLYAQACASELPDVTDRLMEGR